LGEPSTFGSTGAYDGSVDLKVDAYSRLAIA
jgi:hypothetical protein